jgi:hypothetical protein
MGVLLDRPGRGLTTNSSAGRNRLAPRTTEVILKLEEQRSMLDHTAGECFGQRFAVLKFPALPEDTYFRDSDYVLIFNLHHERGFTILIRTWEPH